VEPGAESGPETAKTARRSFHPESGFKLEFSKTDSLDWLVFDDQAGRADQY
jgi:hypothetical protein